MKNLENKTKELAKGTNTENDIPIFGITIRIYLNICFGRSCLCRFRRSFLSGHQTYSNTGTVHEQFEVWKVRSGVSINYVELGSLYMLNCFLTTCNSRRRHSIGKFEFRSVCVTCETRCQHESIDRISKTDSSNRMVCGEAQIKEFSFTIIFLQTAKF